MAVRVALSACMSGDSVLVTEQTAPGVAPCEHRGPGGWRGRPATGCVGSPGDRQAPGPRAWRELDPSVWLERHRQDLSPLEVPLGCLGNNTPGPHNRAEALNPWCPPSSC